MQTIKLSVTVMRQLERKYDAAAIKKINQEVKNWIAADAKRGFQTIHLAVDDPAAMKAHGVPPLKGKVTAPKMKRAIDELCKVLQPDYLVLFGGNDIVPMFVVKNPSFDAAGDDDPVVPTDNPYASTTPYNASKRRSYLVPDRVVGRIPDMLSDGDSGWLLDYLATAATWTSQTANTYAGIYAICCHEWRKAGDACIKFISRRPDSLMITPPVGDATTAARKRLSSRLHMIKCHGAALDSTFYGQKGKDHPDALASATLKTRVRPSTIVAAMCCYGAQVFSPSDPAATLAGEWPLASAYLRKGGYGFAGSTMIAWVGVDQMMCADWIVAGYLKSVLGGASLGRAFLESKQDFVRWINQQGEAPDLADEKTLIEFVLLGDPSIHPVAAAPAKGTIPKPAKAVGAVRAGAGPANGPVSALAMQERRQRRIVREQMAGQMRGLLPVRTAVKGAARDKAVAVLKSAQAVLGKAAVNANKKFGIKPSAARVESLETPLRLPETAAMRGSRGRAVAARVSRRESLEYYWSGRQIKNGHKHIRLVKVETDRRGNVLRAAVLHSS